MGPDVVEQVADGGGQVRVVGPPVAHGSRLRSGVDDLGLAGHTRIPLGAHADVAPTRTTTRVAGSSKGLVQRWRVPFWTTVSPGPSSTEAPSSSSSTTRPDTTYSKSM